MAQMLRRGQLARNVSTIVWMEELEKLGMSYWDFMEYLDGLQHPIVASPIHDRDEYTVEDVRAWIRRHSDKHHYSFITDDLEELEKVAPKVGDAKKSHIHIALKADGRHNGQYYSDLFKDFGLTIADTRWQKVINWDSTVCYMCHMHTPEKYQYPSAGVQGFGGADLSALIGSDRTERTKTLMFVKTQMYEQQYRYYHQLDRWAYSTGDLDIIACVTGRAPYFNSLFASMRHERQDRKEREQERKLAERAATATT